jgi:hypothetical protein
VCESLARNRKVVTYSETDGEKIHMYLNIWNEIKPRKSELSRSDFLQLAKNVIPDRRLLHIMEDPAINELFEVQRKAPIPWMLSAEWKINWLSRVLVSPAGGVRRSSL